MPLLKKLTVKHVVLENDLHFRHDRPLLNDCTYIFSRKKLILKSALGQQKIQNRRKKILKYTLTELLSSSIWCFLQISSVTLFPLQSRLFFVLLLSRHRTCLGGKGGGATLYIT